MNLLNMSDSKWILGPIHTCVALMKEGCYMASLDLRDAYFSVAISRE